MRVTLAARGPPPVAAAAPIPSMAVLPEQPLSRTSGISPTKSAFQTPRTALIVSRSELIVASTAEGSYPQCAMQLAHRGSLPRP